MEGLDNVPMLSFGNAVWGALLCALEAVSDPCEEWTLWKIVGAVQWVHLTEPQNWNVIPVAACCPLELYSHKPGAFPNAVRVRKDGARVPLLKHVFGKKVQLVYEQLRFVADGLGVEQYKRTKVGVVEAIAKHVSKDDTPDIGAAFVAASLEANKQQRTARRMRVVADTEAALEGLDGDDQKEFGVLAQTVNALKRDAKVALWKSDRAKQIGDKKRKGGAAKAKPRKRRRIGPLPKAKAKAKAKAAAPAPAGDADPMPEVPGVALPPAPVVPGALEPVVAEAMPPPAPVPAKPLAAPRAAAFAPVVAGVRAPNGGRLDVDR